MPERAAQTLAGNDHSQFPAAVVTVANAHLTLIVASSAKLYETHVFAQGLATSY